MTWLQVAGPWAIPVSAVLSQLVWWGWIYSIMRKKEIKGDVMEEILRNWPVITGMLGYAFGYFIADRANRRETRILTLQLDSMTKALEIAISAMKVKS